MAMVNATTPGYVLDDQRHTARDTWIVVLLTFAGAVMRLTTILIRGLWLDEAISVDQARQTLHVIIQSLAGDVHPPLFHVLLHYWMHAFGTGELAIRSFSCVWGVLAIPAAYWAGRVIYDKFAGFVAAALVAYSPYAVWYSQEARMYSMMFFFALMSLGFMALALRDNRRWHWVGFGVFTFFGMFTHYFFCFVVLGEVAYFGFNVLVGKHVQRVRAGTSVFSWRRPLSIFAEVPQLAPGLTVFSILAVIFGIWLSRSVFMPSPEGTNALVSSATGAGLGYGQAAPVLAWRMNDAFLVLVEMVAGFHPAPMMYALVAMWPLMISASLVLTDFLRPVGTRSMLPPLAAAGIVLIAALGMWQGQVLASRYFIGVAAPAFLVIAAIVSSMPTHTRTIVFAALIVLTIGMWADQSFDPRNIMRYDTREAVATIVQQHAPGDVTVYEPFYLLPVFRYYMPEDIPHWGFPLWSSATAIRRTPEQIGQDLDRVCGNAHHVWLVLEFENVDTVHEDIQNTRIWFESAGFSVHQDIKFNQVEVVEYDAPPQRYNFVAPPPGPQ